jgi:hypothetical protein
MQEAAEEYRGYKIVVAPIKDCEDMWDFEYRISPVAGGGETRRRSQTAGGHLTPDIACHAGIEVARTEVDNLLALEHAKAP